MKKDIFSFFKNRKQSRDNSSDSSDRRDPSPNFERVSKTILNYFSTEPEKEKVLRYEDFDAAGDEYYATVSAWYKVLQRVFLVGLVCFTLVSVAVNFKTQ